MDINQHGWVVWTKWFLILNWELNGLFEDFYNTIQYWIWYIASDKTSFKNVTFSMLPFDSLKNMPREVGGHGGCNREHGAKLVGFKFLFS